MSLGSVEGVIVALLFVVPGAIGVALRDYLRPARAGSSAFEELVRSLAYSTGTLLLLEIATGLAGLVSPAPWRLGTFLVNDLLGDAMADQLQHDLALWYRLLAFAAVAALLPSLLQRLRSVPSVLRVARAEHISLHNDGFEALFQETIGEAAKWDKRWEFPKGTSPWIMIDTDDGHRYRGQVMWRSTAPEPPELILIEVSDISDPANVADIPGMLLVGSSEIRRLWVMRPDGSPPQPNG